jgi:hypothetical protein
MSSFSRHSLALAAGLLVSGPMWAVCPASAVERPMVSGDVVKPAAVKHPRPHHARRVAVRVPRAYVRPVTAIRQDSDCFGFWCGRQFVLMLGIGY